MSNVGSAHPGLPAELDGLELAIRRLLDDHRACRRRALVAERRVQELEAALNQLRADGPDPLALRRRIEQLEAENRELQGRVTEAAERVRRLLARASFLEEER